MAYSQAYEFEIIHLRKAVFGMHSSSYTLDMNRIPDPVFKCMRALSGAGYRTYLVGGAVRDLLSQKTPSDFDLATEAMPQNILSVFKNYKCLIFGIEHGTVTVVIDHVQIEVTSMRKESNYVDGRRPQLVNFGATLKEDLARRDFTINALALGVEGVVHDYFGGIKDIQEGIIRTVGDPELRFSEDHLRLLRALRFASVLGYSIENATKQAIFKFSQSLERVATPRIWQEWIKLLCGENVKCVLLEYFDVIAIVVPSINKMHGFHQYHPTHCYDVLHHTARVIENTCAIPELRLAALYHDMAKPDTLTIDKQGVCHFHGHASWGAQIAESDLRRLSCPQKLARDAVSLVKKHGETFICDDVYIKKRLALWGPRFFFLLLNLKKADVLAQSKGVCKRIEGLDWIKYRANCIISQNEYVSIQTLAVNGHDLIACGIKEGPEVGRWIRLLLERTIEGKSSNTKNELIKYVRKNCQQQNELRKN